MTRPTASQHSRRYTPPTQTMTDNNTADTDLLNLLSLSKQIHQLQLDVQEDPTGLKKSQPVQRRFSFGKSARRTPAPGGDAGAASPKDAPKATPSPVGGLTRLVRRLSFGKDRKHLPSEPEAPNTVQASGRSSMIGDAMVTLTRKLSFTRNDKGTAPALRTSVDEMGDGAAQSDPGSASTGPRHARKAAHPLASGASLMVRKLSFSRMKRLGTELSSNTAMSHQPVENAPGAESKERLHAVASESPRLSLTEFEDLVSKSQSRSLESSFDNAQGITPPPPPPGPPPGL